VYVKRTTSGITFLTLYLDDIVLDGNNFEKINAIKEWLSSIFEMKDMDKVRYVVGEEISQESSEEAPWHVPGRLHQKRLAISSNAPFKTH